MRKYVKEHSGEISMAEFARAYNFECGEAEASKTHRTRQPNKILSILNQYLHCVAYSFAHSRIFGAPLI